MVAEFERIAKDLDDQIRAEQERSGIHDAGHFAYPTFAKAAMQRRDNLMASAKELMDQRAAAQAELDAALDELEQARGDRRARHGQREAGRGKERSGCGGPLGPVGSRQIGSRKIGSGAGFRRRIADCANG